MKKLLFIFTLLFFLACNLVSTQPKVLEENAGFNLEKIDFSENVSKLYSKRVLNNVGSVYDSVTDGKLSDAMFNYQIRNLLIDVLEIKVPQNDFGYLYKSPEMDSVSKYQNIYFNTLHTLTDLNKKPIAYYAETTFDNHQVRKKYLDDFIKKNGVPKYSFFLNSNFNQCSYEWVLEDRTIQIETSFGWGASIGSSGESSNGKYYLLEILIIENSYKDAIFKTHILEVPDKIMHKGESHNYQDLGFEKITRLDDEFLLNSTDDLLLRNENGYYSIENAEIEE